MNVGKAVKFFREQSKLTQRQLAKASGLSVGYLGKIEHNRCSPSDAVRKKLIDALNINPIMLLVRSIEPSDVPEEKRNLYFKLMPAIEGLVDLMIGSPTKQVEIGGLPKLEKPILTQTELGDFTNELKEITLLTRDGYELREYMAVWIVNEDKEVVPATFTASSMSPFDCFYLKGKAEDYREVMYGK